MTEGLTATPAKSSDGKTWALVCYVTSLIGLVPVGLIIAYVKRGEFLGTIWEGHLTFSIRSFWIGLVGVVLGFVLMFVAVGILVLWAVGIWFLVRIIVGLVKAASDEPINNPRSWLL